MRSQLWGVRVPMGSDRMLPVQKTRVLIVDEDASLSRFLQSYLTRRNFDVSAAATGDEAIRMFRVYDPSVVLLDAMPNLSGIETLERTQADQAGSLRSS